MNSGTNPDDFQTKQIRYFFGRLKRIYGAAYKVQFPNEKALAEACEEWSDIICRLERPIMDAGFDRLKQVMTDDPARWRYPNISAVVSLCKPTPEDYGMPDEFDAWREVYTHCHEPLEHNWSHRAVFIAGQYTRWFDIRNATTAEQQRMVRKRFSREYQRVVERLFITGSELPHQALENQNVTLTPLEKNNRLQEQQLQDTMKQQGIDPRSGRRGFLQRIKQLGFLGGKP